MCTTFPQSISYLDICVCRWDVDRQGAVRASTRLLTKQDQGVPISHVRNHWTLLFSRANRGSNVKLAPLTWSSHLPIAAPPSARDAGCFPDRFSRSPVMSPTLPAVKDVSVEPVLCLVCSGPRESRLYSIVWACLALSSLYVKLEYIKCSLMYLFQL